MSSLGTSCPFCDQIYDSGEHLPRIVHCGVSICSSCLLRFITEKKAITCPYDNERFKPPQSINYLPINHALKEVIYMTQSQIACSQTSISSSQRINKNMPCENTYIEKNNSYGARQRDYKGEAEAQVVALEESLMELRKYEEQLQNFFFHKKESFIKMIQSRFVSLKKFLVLMEEQILSEIRNFFDTQMSELTKHTGPSSVTEKTIRQRIASLSNVRKIPELDNLLNEDISQIRHNLNPRYLKQRIQATKKQLDKDLSGFDDMLTEMGDMMLNLHFPQEVVGENLTKIFLGKSPTGKVAGNSPCITPSKEIKMTSEENTLVLSASKFESDPGNDEIIQWRDKSIVCLNISKEMLEQKKLFGLVSVLSSQTKTTSLRINLTDKKISDEALLTLPPFICWNLKGITSMSIFFDFCQNLSDKSLVPFFGDLFPQMYNLKHLRLSLRGTKASDKTLEALPEYASSVFKGLKSCEILLYQTMVTNKGVRNLFLPMEKIETYKVDFHGTKITGACLQAFAAESLPSMKSLINLDLSLSNTNVDDDDSIIDLLCKLSNLRRLALNFSNTLITDKTLQAFAAKCVRNLYTLETLEMGLMSTQVTDLGLIELILCLSKIKILKLNLRLTKATNRVVDALGSNSELLKSLESFEILTGETLITNLLKLAQIKSQVMKRE